MKKTGLIKTFLTALAGSVALMVALVVMNNLRPATTVVEAAPATASNALAATELTSITIKHMPEHPKYGDDIMAMVMREGEAISNTYTATLMVNGMAITQPAYVELPANTETFSMPVPGSDMWAPATYPISATIYQSGTVQGIVNHEITVDPFIGWDSSVRNMPPMKLGDVLSAAVKVMPAVNYMSNTNEVVEYDFDGDKEVDAGVTITGTNSYMKPDKPNSTYVFDEYLYTKAATYTVGAQYKSGIYGEPTYWATTTVVVKNPVLSFDATVDQENCTVDLAADLIDASENLTPTMVQFLADGEEVAKIDVAGTKAMTTVALPEVTETTTVTMKAVLVSDAFGGEIVATEKDVVVEPCGVCEVTSIALSSTPASPIEAGGTYTVTAQLTEACADKAVGFVTTLGTLGSASDTSDENGKAMTTLTSDVAGTAIVTATYEDKSEGITLVFEDGGTEIDDGGETTIEDAENPENNVTIKIPAGSGKVKAKCTLVMELPNPPSGGRIRDVGNAFSCNFKTMDGKAYTGTLQLQFRRKVGPATLAAATVPTTMTNLIGLGVNQGTTWDILDATSVSVSGDTATATANVTNPSSTDTYARLTAYKAVYLPMIPKPEPTN